MIGWFIGGALVGAALCHEGNVKPKDNKCGNCGHVSTRCYRNSKNKIVYVCTNCGHRWSK